MISFKCQSLLVTREMLTWGKRRADVKEKKKHFLEESNILSSYVELYEAVVSKNKMDIHWI